MTREEAIGHIKDVICENNAIKPNIAVFEQEKEALYMAIEALELMDNPDIISREKMRRIIVDGTKFDTKQDYERVLDAIESVPSCNLYRKRGRKCKS